MPPEHDTTVLHKHLDSHLRIHCIQNNGYIQYRNSLNFRCKNIFVSENIRNNFTRNLCYNEYFSDEYLEQNTCAYAVHAVFVTLDPGRLWLDACLLSIRRYLKPIDGLPDQKGSLSTTIPSAAIAYANREDRQLAEFGGHTPRYFTAYRRGNLSHSKPSPPLSC